MLMILSEKGQTKRLPFCFNVPVERDQDALPILTVPVTHWSAALPP